MARPLLSSAWRSPAPGASVRGGRAARAVALPGGRPGHLGQAAARGRHAPQQTTRALSLVDTRRRAQPGWVTGGGIGAPGRVAPGRAPRAPPPQPLFGIQALWRGPSPQAPRVAASKRVGLSSGGWAQGRLRARPGQARPCLTLVHAAPASRGRRRQRRSPSESASPG